MKNKIINMFRSWKTTVVGSGIIAVAVQKYIETGDLKQSGLLALIGLLGLFAKDASVTGSAKNESK